MAQRFLIATALMLLLVGSTVHAGDRYTNPFDDPDVPDWSDEKVLEYVQHPEAEIRTAAGREMLRRWNQEKLLAYLKKSWRWGLEILWCGSSWRTESCDGVLETYLLAGGQGVDREADATLLLARGGRVPDGKPYETPVGNRVRDTWFAEWITRIPMFVFFRGTIDFICKRSWCRERLYRNDGAWIGAWGVYKRLDGTMYIPWQLAEYRQTVQILCGEPTDEERLRTNGFLTALRAGVQTGKNPCDVEMFSQSSTMSDLLPSTMNISGIGNVAYAELVAIVLDRPDWMPAITKRLQQTVRRISVPKLSPDGKSTIFVDFVTHYDASSPMMSWLASAGSLDMEPAKAGLRAYWRKEWKGYNDYTWQRDLWLRHPWLTKIALDKEFLAWYSSEGAIMPDGKPDVAFLSGEWGR